MIKSIFHHGPRVLGVNKLEQLKERILEAAKVDTPQLNDVDPTVVDTILNRDLAMVQEFEKAALLLHPQVNSDTDVVFVLSGPGKYSRKFPPYGEKPDKYRHLPWARKMDRARVRAGVALVFKITAQRLGKNPKDVTSEDLLRHGPWLHYSSTHWEHEHIKEVLAQSLKGKSSEPLLNIPPEKIIMYENIIGQDGRKRPIVNTADQIEGLRFPEGVIPRRIAVVSHAPHLVRIMHMMEKFKERIPANTIVQPFPLPTPVGGVPEYAKMELQGTLAAIYKLHIASPAPYNYQL